MRRIGLWLYSIYCALLFVATLPVATLVVALLAIPNNSASRRRIWHFLKGWAHVYLVGTFRSPQYLNRPEVPEGFCVAVLNHQSYLDSVLIFDAVPGYFRPLGKIEIGRIPLFGFIYRQITLLVDRSSPHSRARSMKLMVRSLRREGHVAIFPEGTFNETHEEAMLRFYDGAFRLAIDAQVPLLPILMPDTADRWNGVQLWKMSPGRNRVYYLPPVPTERLTQEDLPLLRDQIREQMIQAMQLLKR
jgi:1-acyl-sn-glycerol-3-phosphate acyltransferase